MKKLISRRLYNFVISIEVLPNAQFGFRKDVDTADSFLLLTQSSLDKWAEAQILSFDFTSVFDSINHQGLLYKLKSVGVVWRLMSSMKGLDKVNKCIVVAR